MPVIIEPPQAGAPAKPLAQRLGWFFGIAAVSALATIAVAYLLKALLQ